MVLTNSCELVGGWRLVPEMTRLVEALLDSTKKQNKIPVFMTSNILRYPENTKRSQAL